MTSSKSEKYQELEESKGSPRDRRMRKRRYPRSRGYAVRQKRGLEIERSRRIEVDVAQEKIAKHLTKFPNLDTDEGRKQAEKYLNWVVDSLSGEIHVLSEKDIEYKTAVASVKAGGQQRQKTRSSVRATHLPTLISVRNEEERSFEQNKERAYDNVLNRLTEHLSLWRTLTQKLPEKYSLSEIERRGVDLLKEL